MPAVFQYLERHLKKISATHFSKEEKQSPDICSDVIDYQENPGE